MKSSIRSRTTNNKRSTPYSRCQGRWRKRPNHELEYLQHQLMNLEEALAVLHQPDVKCVSTLRTLEIRENESWEEIATRQSTLANAALKENLKLRSMMEEQLRDARALETVIDQYWKKACRVKRWFSGDASNLQPTDLSDELLYALLDENLTSIYASMDKELEGSADTNFICDFLPQIQVQPNTRDVSFRHSEVRLIPFPVSNVVHALNNLLSVGNSGRPLARCRKLWKRNNHVHATTVVNLQLPKARQVEVTVRLVHRIFAESPRIGLIWTAYVEIKGSMFVRLEEKGWILLEPYYFREKAIGSTLRSVARVDPILQFSSEEQQEHNTCEMIDLVTDTYNCNFAILYQALENLMLKYAIIEHKHEKQP